MCVDIFSDCCPKMKIIRAVFIILNDLKSAQNSDLTDSLNNVILYTSGLVPHVSQSREVLLEYITSGKRRLCHLVQ